MLSGPCYGLLTRHSPQLLPCPNMAQTYTCTKYRKSIDAPFGRLAQPRCNYTDPTSTSFRCTLAAVDTQKQQPSKTTDVDELKTMLLSLMKDGAEQKALITATLTAEDQHYRRT
jgi:hypothetical protein